MAKIENMVDLRAFALEQVVKIVSSEKKCDLSWGELRDCAKVLEDYIRGNAELPETPTDMNKILSDFTQQLTENSEKNDKKFEEFLNSLGEKNKS